MNDPKLHISPAPVAVGPSGPGAIGGFQTTCPDCGLVIRSSLIGIAAHDATEHWLYMRDLCEGQPAMGPAVAQCGKTRTHGRHIMAAR